MTDTSPRSPAAPAAPLSEAEDKQWASFAHFGNILSFVAPLIIWLIFKDRGAKTNVEGKEAVNWGINVAGLLVANVILGVIFGFIPVIGLIWVFLGPLIWIAIVVAQRDLLDHGRHQGQRRRQLPLPGEHPLDQVVL